MAGRVRKTFFSALQSRHSQQTEMRSVVSFQRLLHRPLGLQRRVRDGATEMR
jgi:hypothetical protein